MRITLCGAAGEVTGSGYLVETDTAKVLVDFGMFQGRGASFEKNRRLGPVDPRRLDAVVLTHAHLDHCGRLPLLTTRGHFKARIYCTAATADFAELVLLDSAHIQEEDARRLTRRRLRQGKPAAESLYTSSEVEAILGRFDAIPYDQSREIATGVSIRLVDAGHMLGSASVEMTIQDRGARRVLVFSGDLGPRGAPFLRDPVPLPHADLLFLESTYGDRDHRSMDETLDQFRQILRDAERGRERVLIPSFAIGRSQQILYYIAEFVREGSIPKIPVYLDSPMAIRATQLYAEHQNLFDEEAGRLTRGKQLEKDLSELHFSQTADDSRELNNLRDAAVIIAASGMCEGGRILHHLKHNLWRKYVNVVFVGYQAEGTLGSRIVHGAKRVRVLGEEVVVGADIQTLGGFSAHAGQTELLEWAGHAMASKPRVVLTHGEERQRATLAGQLKERYGVEAQLPELGTVIELD